MLKQSDRLHLMGLLELHQSLTMMIGGWVGERDITLVDFTQLYAAAAHWEIEDDLHGTRPRTPETEQDKEDKFQSYAKYVEVAFYWDAIEAHRAGG